MPLELATRAICNRVYHPRGRRGRLACTLEQLNGIAYAVAALVPLFAYEADGVTVRPLGPEEISQGLFRDGGRTLFFLDGRAAIRPLAVPASGVDDVTRALAEHDR